jgi:hypothetical protein
MIFNHQPPSKNPQNKTHFRVGQVVQFTARFLLCLLLVAVLAACVPQAPVVIEQIVEVTREVTQIVEIDPTPDATSAFHPMNMSTGFPPGSLLVQRYTDQHILIFNTDGSGYFDLSEASGIGDCMPNWFPNGVNILLSCKDGLKIIRRDGTNFQELVEINHENLKNVALSHDGQKIAYRAEQGIYVVNAETGISTLLTEDVDQDRTCISWSWNDQSIYTWNKNSDVVTIDIASHQSSPYQINLPHLKIWYAQESPNGQQILFLDQNRALYIANRDGTNPILLTDEKTYVYTPVWSPSSNLFAYRCVLKENSDQGHPEGDICLLDIQKAIVVPGMDQAVHLLQIPEKEYLTLFGWTNVTN